MFFWKKANWACFTQWQNGPYKNKHTKKTTCITTRCYRLSDIFVCFGFFYIFLFILNFLKYNIQEHLLCTINYFHWVFFEPDLSCSKPRSFSTFIAEEKGKCIYTIIYTASQNCMSVSRGVQYSRFINAFDD